MNFSSKKHAPKLNRDTLDALLFCFLLEKGPKLRMDTAKYGYQHDHYWYQETRRKKGNKVLFHIDFFVKS